MSQACTYCGRGHGVHSANCPDAPLKAGANVWRDPDTWTSEQWKDANEWLRKNEAALRGRETYTPLVPAETGKEAIMAGANYTRIGDSERARTADHLAVCFSTGHITQEEFYERSDKVTEARTQADLDYLTRDLPAPKAVKKPTRTVRFQAMPGKDDQPVIFSPVKWLLSSGFFLMIGALACPVWAAAANGIGNTPGAGTLAIIITFLGIAGAFITGILFSPARQTETEE